MLLPVTRNNWFNATSNLGFHCCDYKGLILFLTKLGIVIYFHILLVKNKYKKNYIFYNIISVKKVTLVMTF